jgi:hypothetical protein
MLVIIKILVVILLVCVNIFVFRRILKSYEELAKDLKSGTYKDDTNIGPHHFM